MSERVKVKEEPKGRAKDEKAGALHEALEDTFPASDPPAQTQPITPGRPASDTKPVPRR